jgi:hypothetical protein
MAQIDSDATADTDATANDSANLPIGINDELTLPADFVKQCPLEGKVLSVKLCRIRRIESDFNTGSGINLGR